MSWSHNQKLIEKIYERDGYKCVYCGSTENLSIDHRIPQKYGGNNSEKNLVTACKKCNSSKNCRLEDSLREQVINLSGWKPKGKAIDYEKKVSELEELNHSYERCIKILIGIVKEKDKQIERYLEMFS